MILRTARARTAATMAFLLLANCLAWTWAWRAFPDRPALLGTALLAWVFGLRHAVDADHIAAIDNVVRKLVQTGQRASDAGLFFALGHSAVVLLACGAIMLFPAAESLRSIRGVGEGWGTLVSAGFLLLIGGANFVTLCRLWRGRGRDAPLAGGFMMRVLRPVQRLVGRGWHMLPVGFLFGLGFDTASEVALLLLTGQQAAAGLPASDLLVFPTLFTAGMVLLDTADSAIMTEAYSWAFHHPRHRFWYNVSVTGLSVFVAVGVGGLEVLDMLAGGEDSPLRRVPIVAWLLDMLPYMGFAVVAVLLLLWGMAALVWRARPRLAVPVTE